jgi:hypothetical protein
MSRTSRVRWGFPFAISLSLYIAIQALIAIDFIRMSPGAGGPPATTSEKTTAEKTIGAGLLLVVSL